MPYFATTYSAGRTWATWEERRGPEHGVEYLLVAAWTSVVGPVQDVGEAQVVVEGVGDVMPPDFRARRTMAAAIT